MLFDNCIYNLDNRNIFGDPFFQQRRDRLTFSSPRLALAEANGNRTPCLIGGAGIYGILRQQRDTNRVERRELDLRLPTIYMRGNLVRCQIGLRQEDGLLCKGYPSLDCVDYTRPKAA